MYDGEIYVLDTETTGLSPHKDRVVQLGFSKINPTENRILELSGKSRDSLIFDICQSNMLQRTFNPEVEMNDTVIRIHGITNEVAEKNELFSDVVHRLMKAIPEGSILLMHNAPFDVGMIYAECVRSGPDVEKWFGTLQAIDSLEISRKVYKKGRHNLDALCKRLDVEVIESKRHSADGDVLMLAQCWCKLIYNSPQSDLFSSDHMVPRPILDFIEREALHDAVFRELGKEIEVNTKNNGSGVKLELSQEDTDAHNKMMKRIREECGGDPIWMDDNQDEIEIGL